MHDDRTERSGLCECGCGGRTKVATVNHRATNQVKGRPMRFISGHNSYRTDPLYDVVDAGHETPCWLWRREVGRNGYGRKRVDGVNRLAHRWMYEQAGGLVPEGWHVHHACKNRACVNPQHLEPLSPREHLQRDKGKLTAESVRDIKRRITIGTWGINVVLAKEYGVGVKTISDIRTGKTWVNV